MRRLIILAAAAALSACASNDAIPAAQVPTATQPAPTSTPAPTAAPTATPDPAAALLELVEDAAAPILADGDITAERADYGAGPRVNVTMPLNDLGSAEQIVRLNQIRMAGVAKALLDTYPELAEVNVIGTLDGTSAISLLVTRDQYTAWDGIPANLPGWQVSGRLQ